MSDKENGLKRELRLFDAVMIVVGNVVGIGIFTTTGMLAQELPDAHYILIIWVMGGILTLCGALTYGELGAAFPYAGGDYVYLRNIYGSWAGFLLGWVGFFIINPGSIAALSLGLAKYLLPLSFGGEYQLWEEKSLAIFSLLLISLINYLGVKYASRLQNLCSGFNLVIIFLILLSGFIWGSGNLDHFSFSSKGLSLGDFFGPAMIAVVFTYSGWFVSAYVASEIKNPEKNLPLSLILSSLIVTIVYLLMNIFYIYALPIPEMEGIIEIASSACGSLFGPGATAIVSLAIILAILGSLNSVILTAPRIYYAMAKDGIFFRKAGTVHSRYQTPYVSIILQAVISSFLVVWGNFYQLLTYVVFIMLITSIATGLGVFVLRFRCPKLKRPYKVGGYPYTTLIFVAFYLWIALKVLVEKPYESILGVAITLSGIPFYVYWRKKKGVNI